MIEIFYKNERIVSHPRILSGKGKYVTLEEHMPQNHKMYSQWNKERIIEWSRKIGDDTYRLIASIFDKARFEVQIYNQCITILKLSDKYSKETLESACGYILEKRISPIHKILRWLSSFFNHQRKTKKKERMMGPSSEVLPTTVKDNDQRKLQQTAADEIRQDGGALSVAVQPKGVQ